MTDQSEQMLTLVNPMSDHFAKFIFRNATECEKVVEEDLAKGQHIVICGAGPTLADHIKDYLDADQIWGCNSAAIWLANEGYPVTHGFTIDQTPHMCTEWYEPPAGLKFLVASTCHPHLIEYLKSEGADLTFFHNFVGLKGPPVKFGLCQSCNGMADTTDEACPSCGGPLKRGAMSYESWLYVTLYEATVRVGSGLNSVSRAIELAVFMGAGKISVLGADCALRASEPAPAMIGSPEYKRWIEGVQMHVDGGNALKSGATAQTVEAVIDGRYWVTKPDMAITAVFLAEMKKHYGDLLDLVGDTLPNAIMDKPDEWLDRLPSLSDNDGKRIRFTPGAKRLSVESIESEEALTL